MGSPLASTLESRDIVEEILNMLNKLHKSIKFTAEFEDQNNISFLDVRVKRESEGFITDVYRKQTFSGTYLHWNSLTTSQYKINLIKCLLDRSFSYLKLFHQEIQWIKLILLENEYPITVLNNTIKKYLGKRFTPVLNYNVKGKPVYMV